MKINYWIALSSKEQALDTLVTQLCAGLLLFTSHNVARQWTIMLKTEFL